MVKHNHDKRAIASLVLGILSGGAWLIPILGVILTVIGIIIGKNSYMEEKNKIAMWGLILNIVFLLASIGYFIYGFVINLNAAF